MAVDFTASNGDPGKPSSLHYIEGGYGGGGSNQYLDALSSVGTILEQYDTDKLYPVYGFGGQIPERAGTSHCFALNGDIFKPECIGVQGIINAYFSSI